MMSSADSKVDDENNRSTIIVNCSSIYQLLLPKINSVMRLTTAPSTFDTQFISTAVSAPPKVFFGLRCLFNTG
jgi:hypothetical protein